MAKSALFGIIDIAVHLPSLYVDQKELLDHLKLDPGKYLIGLGLEEASVCNYNEDPVSLAMNAVHKLLCKHDLRPEDIGRLEVGTESNWDGSKSLKTCLMDLFKSNRNIGGCDTKNACYGGTSALFNAIHWLESSFYDGRYAIVVCTDAAIYKEHALMPLAGAAACAILLGPNPVLRFRSDMVHHHFGNTFDFYKPCKNYPYPVIDGRFSVAVYNEAFAENYRRIGPCVDMCKHAVFHTPYPRLPEKNCNALGIPAEKVLPSLIWARKIGNSYTASLYISLASLLANTRVLVNDCILMYSFGSGFASSLFVLEKVREGMEKDTYNIFGDRMKVNADTFVRLMNADVQKSGDCGGVVYDGYYLLNDNGNMRSYGFLRR
eukprot:jgi/Antlo1/421/909